MPEAPASKHDPSATFEAITESFRKEREQLTLQIAAEEVRGAKVLLRRASKRLQAVDADFTVRRDCLFAMDSVSELREAINEEAEERS